MLTREKFNEVDNITGKASIQHNDTWYESLQQEYFDLCEKSDDILEANGKTEDITEEKVYVEDKF